MTEESREIVDFKEKSQILELTRVGLHNVGFQIKSCLVGLNLDQTIAPRDLRIDSFILVFSVLMHI